MATALLACISAGLVAWLPAPRAIAGDQAAAPFPALAPLATQVLAKGLPGNLPAALSRVLGLGEKGGPVPVRQVVQRQAGEVHVYNVVEPGQHPVVLLRVSEAKASTEAFLLDAKGALLRAVRYEGGGDAQDMTAAEAAAAYAREAQLWLALAGRSAAASGPVLATPRP
jgi:hypothetical protein